MDQIEIKEKNMRKEQIMGFQIHGGSTDFKVVLRSPFSSSSVSSSSHWQRLPRRRPVLGFHREVKTSPLSSPRQNLVFPPSPCLFFCASYSEWLSCSGVRLSVPICSSTVTLSRLLLNWSILHWSNSRFGNTLLFPI